MEWIISRLHGPLVHKMAQPVFPTISLNDGPSQALRQGVWSSLVSMSEEIRKRKLTLVFGYTRDRFGRLDVPDASVRVIFNDTMKVCQIGEFWQVFTFKSC